MSGIVYLVGAGPGDPGLLTLRGAELLAAADLVLYDGLVSPLLLRMTRGQCERTARTREGTGPHVPQAEVNARLIAAAQQGLRVVRLKGGDPFLFGRGSEEAAALAAAGIPFEVVPGVTAAIAAGEYTGISFTHRELASAVAFVTGHEDPSKSARPLDYAALARFPGTLVFYMGLHRLASICKALADAGLDHSTPAAVICQATLPTQRTVVGTVETIAKLAAEAGLRPPSLIVIGTCVTQRERIAWLERRPLFGLRIGITRPEDRALRPACVANPVAHDGPAGNESGLDATLFQCLSLGAEPVLMPAIEVGPVADFGPLDAILERLADFDWLVFTSGNGVRALLERLWDQGGDSRRLQRCRIACIGPSTAGVLAEYRLRADLVPDVFRAEELAAALAPLTAGSRVLWARASRGRDVLPNTLRQAGADVTEVVVYEHRDLPELSQAVRDRLARRELDWIGLSSPTIAAAVARQLREIEPSLGSWRPKLAAISPLTAEAAARAGLTVAAVATTYTWEGIFAAIRDAVAAERETRGS